MTIATYKVKSNKLDMELVSGFLLWVADVSGVKWIRQEKSPYRKAAKVIVFLIAGILLVMTFLVFWNT
jgi:hypothetical protein